MIKLWLPILGSCPQRDRIFDWRFGNGWHCSRATKFSMITH